MSTDSATEWVRGMVLALTEPHYHSHVKVRWDASSWVVSVPTAAVGALLGEGGINADALRRLAWSGASARHLLQHKPWLRPAEVLSIGDGGGDEVGWLDALDLEAATASALDFIKLAARGPVAKGEIVVFELSAEHPRHAADAVCIGITVPEKQTGRLMGAGGRTIEDLRLLLRCHLRARGWRGGCVLVFQPTTHRRDDDRAIATA